jgi:fluoride exporter
VTAVVDLLLVALGGAAGAAGRYLVERAAAQRVSSNFPYGILVPNITGSFLLGLLLAAVTGPWLVLLGVGFCGAFTTYSTFAHDTVRLMGDRRGTAAVVNIAVSLVAGLVAVAGGWALGSSLG